MDSRSVESFVCTEIEKQNNIKLCPYGMDFISPYNCIWHNFRGGTDRCTQAVPYEFIHTVLSWHINRGRLLCFFFEKFGMVFKAFVQPLMHPENC
jgi:hypothetical protein